MEKYERKKQISLKIVNAKLKIVFDWLLHEIGFWSEDEDRTLLPIDCNYLFSSPTYIYFICPAHLISRLPRPPIHLHPTDFSGRLSFLRVWEGKYNK